MVSLAISKGFLSLIQWFSKPLAQHRLDLRASHRKCDCLSKDKGVNSFSIRHPLSTGKYVD
jgi:hypothetical protein